MAEGLAARWPSRQAKPALPSRAHGQTLPPVVCAPANHWPHSPLTAVLHRLCSGGRQVQGGKGLGTNLFNRSKCWLCYSGW